MAIAPNKLQGTSTMTKKMYSIAFLCFDAETFVISTGFHYYEENYKHSKGLPGLNTLKGLIEKNCKGTVLLHI